MCHIGNVRFILLLFVLVLCLTAAPAGAQDLTTLGKQYTAAIENGDVAEADRIARRGLAQAERGINNGNLITWIENLAEVERRQHRFGEAEKLYRRALPLEEQRVGKDHEYIAYTLHNLATVVTNQGRYDEAEPLYQRALQIKEREFGPDHIKVAGTLNNLALLHHNQNRYTAAEPLYQRVLRIYEKAHVSSQPDVALALNNLAMLYAAQARYADAELLYQRALRIREQVGSENSDVAGTLSNLAILYKAQGRHADSEQLFLRALRILETAHGPRHPIVAGPLNNLAALYMDRGLYADAELFYQRALKIYEEVFGSEHPDVAMVLHNLANLNYEQSRYAAAEPLYKRSLKIKEKLLGPDHSDVALTLDCLANLYANQARSAESEPLYQRALRIREKAFGRDHPDVALTLNNLADLYSDHGRYAESEAILKRALQIYENVFGPDHADVAQMLNNLADLFAKQGRFAEAQNVNARSIDIYERVVAPPSMVLRSYWVRAALTWLQNRRTEAVIDLARVLDRAEQQRQQFSGAEQERAEAFAQFSSRYEMMVHCQREMGDVPAAFQAVERSRARTLQDQLGGQQVDLLDGVPPAEADRLRNAERTAQGRVSELEQQLNRLSQRNDLSDAERQKEQERVRGALKPARQTLVDTYVAIRNASPAYRLMIQQDFKPASLDQLQAWAEQQEAAVMSYFLGDQQGYLFILLPGQSPQLVTLTTRADSSALTSQRLTELLQLGDQTLLQHLATPELSDAAAQRLAELYDILIPKDVQQALTDGSLQRLVVIPDGPLALLPFETLVVEPGDDPQYLFDVSPPIQYVPSGTVLLNLAARELEPTPKDLKPVLTVANPSYPGETVQLASRSALDELNPRSRFTTRGGQLVPLPHTATEAAWLVDAYNERGTLVGKLLARDATEAKLRYNVPGRRIVHLACHGLIDQQYGNFFGALALTPGKDAATNPLDDGFLTLPEIYNLDLKACELAILSACETNSGPQQRGEGTWALSRGCLVAGARRVVASNWLVDDEAAASLVSLFCAGVAESEKQDGTADHAAALQQAKRYVRSQEQWRSPYYWGAFVLVGPQ